MELAVMVVCATSLLAGLAAYYVASERTSRRIASSNQEWHTLEDELEGES